VEDARQRVTRWIEEAPGFVEMVWQVVDDRQRALTAVADTERQCAMLREELAAARAECDELKRDRSETSAMLAEALGRTGEALQRLRPSADVRFASPAAAPAPTKTSPPMEPSADVRFASPAAAPAPTKTSSPIEPLALFADRPSLPSTLFAAAPPMVDPIEAVAEPCALSPAEAVAEPPAKPLAPSSPVEAVAAPPEPEPVEAADAPRVAAPEATGATSSVLLVDDDLNFRNVMTEYLEGIRGYGVRAAASGEEGLSMLEHYQPDIVLLDLMMPGMGGMAALQNMKALYPSLCVVMVTANEDLSLARRALSLGAADYVTKPFDLDYLDALLNMYLMKDQPASEHPARTPSTSPSLGPIPSPSSADGAVTGYAAVDESRPVLSPARSLRSYFTRR